MQPAHGPAGWEPVGSFRAAPCHAEYPPYPAPAGPPSRYPAPGGGWPTEASFQQPHGPAAAPVVPQRGHRPAEPAVAAGAPATALGGPGAAGDAPQKTPPPLSTDTRVVCGPLSRLAALPADPRRWLVLLAQLEEPPAAGGPRRRFTVREPDGTRTECVYYELERPLPALHAGKWVRCVGRLDARGVFVCVTARPAARQDIGLHRQLQQLAQQPAADGK
ncbi:Spermatogenesis-associated protein 22 [Amphibalanus amphitrite]|uniref:Spermatogenesis-associated protein 22 n=1 Tax=Amphibalanus amphitrite TaxID=1232801 RepID=A0A6A4VYX6_AMPAM|nr:Spermatogenesis-associated protein 22 [Amphibalanus amphitrite]